MSVVHKMMQKVFRPQENRFCSLLFLRSWQEEKVLSYHLEYIEDRYWGSFILYTLKMSQIYYFLPPDTRAHVHLSEGKKC